jgi:hypothetical protein
VAVRPSSIRCQEPRPQATDSEAFATEGNSEAR